MEELPINITDAGILVVLFISAVFGFARGFSKEILSISGWIGATFLTLYAFPYLQPLTREYIANFLVADIVAGAVFFILCLVILSYITHGISDRVKASALGALDRTLGIFFGLIRAVVIVGVGWLIFVQFMPPENRPVWVMEAKMLPVVRASGEFVARLAPEDMQQNLQILTEKFSAAGGRWRKDYDSIPAALRDDVEKSLKDAADTLEKGYDSKSRLQMENLSKSSEVKE